jgi:hypothetical protein
MNILVLNGSPKKRGGASKYFSGILKRMLFNNSFTEFSLRGAGKYNEIFEQMKTADALILSLPLYIDGVPSHVLRFLKEAERFCNDNACRFKLYVISNNGFIEGRQNQTHLEQLRNWCGRAGVTWGGGLGIGGGVMLHILIYATLANIALDIVITLINFLSGTPVAVGALLESTGKTALVWLFFNSGMLYFLWTLSRAIQNGGSMKNRYARVMLPSFLFLLISDIFMLIMALFNGKLIFSLYKKDDFTPNARG